jgi:hypothetical protein
MFDSSMIVDVLQDTTAVLLAGSGTAGALTALVTACRKLKDSMRKSRRRRRACPVCHETA